MLKWRSLVRRCRRNMRFLIIFSCILLISDSMFGTREFYKDFKLHSSNWTRAISIIFENSLVHVFFKIALETMLLPILIKYL